MAMHAHGRNKGDSSKGEFRGKCLRCGKCGHKAQFCPQGGGKAKGPGKAGGVGFVFTNWTEPDVEKVYAGTTVA